MSRNMKKGRVDVVSMCGRRGFGSAYTDFLLPESALRRMVHSSHVAIRQVTAFQQMVIQKAFINMCRVTDKLAMFLGQKPRPVPASSGLSSCI